MSFEKEYKKLNSAQRQAVDNIDGPLMVIAGPGTGKTQLLSARVANILKKTDVYPGNILCLTFTNKATNNMANRLFEVIGQDARSIVVNTFHGLAADIMNKHPEFFWRGAKLSIAPDAIQLQAMQRILYNFPADHPLSLKFVGQFTLVDEVTNAVKAVKEAGLTPNKLRAVINSNVEYIDSIEPDLAKLGKIKVSSKSIEKYKDIVESLPDQQLEQYTSPLISLSSVIKESFAQSVEESEKLAKNSPISKWKSRWLQPIDGSHKMVNERDRNNWWLAVADAYEKYRKHLHKLGYYDFADMLVEVIGQIEQQPNLRAQLQEQYQYVLIDEFQDTNAAQLRLAHLISDHSELEQPNIMAVGDDDQSIYKFQGAELSNMLGFTSKYHSAKLIVLKDNYRSNQNILNASEKIISTANYRLVKRLPKLSKKLVAKNSPKKVGKIGHLSFRSREEQLSVLADQAGNFIKLNDSVAILARGHDSLRDIAKILHAKKIPITYEQSSDILKQPAVEQLVLILKVISNIKKGRVSEVNELLSTTLRHPMWQLDTKKLWKFAVSQQTKHNWLQGLSEAKDKQFKQIADWLDYLVSLSASEPLTVVMECVLGLREAGHITSPIKSHYLSSGVNELYIETLSAVKVLRSLVSEFQTSGKPSVQDFVDFTELMSKNNKTISDSSPFVNSGKCVELLTVHKAKGLEFDAVVVVDAVSSTWSPGRNRRIPPANLPLRPAEDDADDYARLMYVAATRAKHTLLIGSYQQNFKGEDVLPAIALSTLNPIVQKPLSGNQLISTLEHSLLWPSLKQSDEKLLLKPRLEDYSLNVSNLINFLDLSRGGPQYFKERSLLRLPEAKSPASAIGSAVHAALEDAQLLTTNNKFKLEKILTVFDKALLAEGLPEADYKKKLSAGHQILKRFIEKHGWQFNKGALPEYRVVGVHLGEIKLGGTLDVLDSTGDNSLISDYKTGRPLKSLGIKSGDAGINAWKHKLQLVFYALLAEVDPHIKVKGELICQMVYVEADKKTDLVKQYQPPKDELTRLSTLIQAVWRHIMELDFPDISKYSADSKGIEQFEEDLIKGKC